MQDIGDEDNSSKTLKMNTSTKATALRFGGRIIWEMQSKQKAVLVPNSKLNSLNNIPIFIHEIGLVSPIKQTPIWNSTQPLTILNNLNLYETVIMQLVFYFSMRAK